jgi:uncharacterized protein
VTDLLIVAATLAVMLVGLAGVILPILPGVVVVGVAAIAGTFALGVDTAGGWTLVISIAVLTLIGEAASWVLPAHRGLAGGAPRSSLGIAAASGFVGFFVIPVVGLPVGAVIGLYAAEMNRTGDRRQAWTTTRSVITGYGIGVLVELVLSVLIVATWLTSAVVNLS